jgi:hypothetical protein
MYIGVPETVQNELNQLTERFKHQMNVMTARSMTYRDAGPLSPTDIKLEATLMNYYHTIIDIMDAIIKLHDMRATSLLAANGSSSGAATAVIDPQDVYNTSLAHHFQLLSKQLTSERQLYGTMIRHYIHDIDDVIYHRRHTCAWSRTPQNFLPGWL